MKKGLLIVIEGIDGSGGETQSDLLKKDPRYSVFSFPNYTTEIGELIDAYLHRKVEIKDDMILAQLMLSNMREFSAKIRNDIDNGIDVVCDRYFSSSIAHQSINYEENAEKIISIVKALDLPIPDIVMYLDITAEESYKRKSHEKLGEENLDRHESNLDFLNNVRRRYLETEGGNLCDWKKIDATQSIEKVQDEILQTINELRKKQEI